MTREEAICGLEDMLMSKIDARNNLEVYGEEIPIMLVQDIEAFKLAIEALQERPKGRWIEEYKSYLDPHTGEGLDEVFFKCPICGRWESAKEPFCHCGADMRESEQE